MINEKYLKELTPVELEVIRNYVLSDICPQLDGTLNAENLNKAVSKCPHCDSSKISKWGFNNEKRTQRFKCKECGRYFSSTTGTMFFASNTDFDTWSEFIDCEIKGLTLAEEEDTIDKSKTSCFNMRHKLHHAAQKAQKEVSLGGEVEMDCTFLPISFKGTKPEKMIRKSKQRGKHKRAIHKTKTENKEPQLCIFTAIDLSSNILFRISHCGWE